MKVRWALCDFDVHFAACAGAAIANAAASAMRRRRVFLTPARLDGGWPLGEPLRGDRRADALAQDRRSAPARAQRDRTPPRQLVAAARRLHVGALEHDAQHDLHLERREARPDAAPRPPPNGI